MGVCKGQQVLLRKFHDTLFEHPMRPLQLPGHCFRVLAHNDKPNPMCERRDTAMRGPRDSCDIAFVAENPGVWMFRCHIVDHAAGGMTGPVAVID